MDLDEYRRLSLATWDRMSSAWEREREFMRESTAAIRERLIERVDPQPGETLLEVAAGTGDTGLIAAERVGPHGRLISTDFAPGMVQATRSEGERLGLTNAEYRQLDAERMDLEDSSVDGVLCRWGYMLMADPAAALAETRRVLRDGGRLAFAVWTTPDRNPWAAIPGMTMVELGHIPPPEPGAPGIFALADQARIDELVRGAGFADHSIEEVGVSWGYTDPDEHWEKTISLAGPITEAFAGLSASEQDEVRNTVHSRVASLLAEREDGLDGHCWVVTAS
ncbi:MAG: methyltransferase domain-containing protein [bacterium]